MYWHPKNALHFCLTSSFTAITEIHADLLLLFSTHIDPISDSDIKHRETSNIRRTKSQTFNDSCLVLQLALFNPLKPAVKSRMKM